MVLKTFNVQGSVYNKFSRFCKEHGISMSKQIDIFMQFMVVQEPEVKKEYLKKLERVRKGEFIRIDNFAARYGI